MIEAVIGIVSANGSGNVLGTESGIAGSRLRTVDRDPTDPGDVRMGRFSMPLLLSIPDSFDSLLNLDTAASATKLPALRFRVQVGPIQCYSYWDKMLLVLRMVILGYQVWA